MVVANSGVVLLGRDERWTKRWGVGVVVLLLISAIYFAAVKAIGYPTIHLFLWWEGYAVLLVALISVQAYSNEGMVMSWMLAFAAMVGAILNYGGIGLTGSRPGLLQLTGFALIGGLLGAAIIGILGFGIGMAIRRIERTY